MTSPFLATTGTRSAKAMDNRTEVRGFLTRGRGASRPSRPDSCCTAPTGASRNAPRRSCPACRRQYRLLATRLERGNLTGVSESVLEAVASALKLDESERTHLFDLAQAANTSPRQRRSAPGQGGATTSDGRPAHPRFNRGAGLRAAATASICSA